MTEEITLKKEIQEMVNTIQQQLNANTPDITETITTKPGIKAKDDAYSIVVEGDIII